MPRDFSLGEFGLIIAYLLPGYATVWGVSIVTGIAQWPDVLRDGPTVGGFLSTTAVALTVGVTLSTLRWLLIDPLHHATGIRPTQRRFAALVDSLAAYTFLNDAHYRYYQHAAGMLLATILVYTAWRYTDPFRPIEGGDVAMAALSVLYYLGSRDTLRKFYDRTGELLGSPPQKSRKAK